MATRLRDFRKIIAMIFILLAVTYSLGFWLNVFYIGILLLMEHLIVYGRFDFFDFLGHEWIGLIMVLTPLVLFGLWISAGLVIIAFLLACRYSWHEKLSPIKYALKKVRL